MKDRIFDWLASKIKRPRLWSDEEWENYTSKEKLWIWYKHHWYIRSTGSAEVDQFTNPIKEIILYGGIILSNVALALMYLGIEIRYFTMIFIVGISCAILWIGNFALQWKLGNWIDNKDLIALGKEIDVRRTKVFREIREQSMKQPFRKRKV